MIPRLACLLLALAPFTAFAQSPPVAETPTISSNAPVASPQPGVQSGEQRLAQKIDYQAMIDTAIKTPDAVIILRFDDTADQLPISPDSLFGMGHFWEMDFSNMTGRSYAFMLPHPVTGQQIPVPLEEFAVFAEAHPEYIAEVDIFSIEPGSGPWMSVRRVFIEPPAYSLGGAYRVILIAGPDLRGDPRLASAGRALCGQPEYSEDEDLDPDRLAIIAAPISRALEEGDKVNLGEDYDHDRVSRWIDTLTGTKLGREARTKLNSSAFGFVATVSNPIEFMEFANPEGFDELDAIYIDLSAISVGYVEEVVARIVKGMHEGDATSNTGAISVLEAFSLVERIGATTLEVVGLLEPSTAQAAPTGEGC